MSNGINIAFASDVRDLLKGTGNAETALEKVADALDNIDGAPLERELSKTMDGVSADTKSAADQLEKKFSDAFSAVKSDAKSAGDVIDRETHSGVSKAGEATGEFKSEAVQNFSEVSSSFSGDMSSAVDLVQGTLGGLAASLPGLGLAFGVAGAAVGAVFGQMQANAEKTKQTVADMYSDMLASGLDYLSKDYAQSQIDKIIKGDSDALIKMSDAQNIAALSGQELSTVLAAVTGDSAEAARVTAGLNAATQESKDAYDEARASAGATTDELSSLYYTMDNNQRTTDAWNNTLAGTAGSLSTATSNVNSARDAMSKLTGEFDHTTDAAMRVSQGIGAIPDNKTITLTVDSSAVDAWLKKPKVFTAGVVIRPGQMQVV